MGKKKVIENLKCFAQSASGKFDVKMIILYGSWLAETAREEDEIEVAVVFTQLKADEDYLETKNTLVELGHEIDPRIEPVLIETNKEDPVGFFRTILRSGEIIYPG